MALFGLRFDFRNPPLAGTSMADRYAAALDMIEWADDLGALFVVLSEHHGSDDGYLPSALTMAAAVAARTDNVLISISAIVAALHDPLRLAEEAAVVDHLSRGRLSLVITNGYVADEFAMFGRALGERVSATTEAVETLRRAWTGEPFEYRGRAVRVTPPPFQPGGPALSLGGSSEAAARRAARLGMGFMPSNGDVFPAFREESIALGRPDPGPHPGGDTGVVHLADDPEAGWAAIAPFFLHEANAYGRWAAEAGIAGATGYRPETDTDALRATGQYRVLAPDDLVAEQQAAGPFGVVVLHPLVGGTPPEVGWSSLKLFETQVLPRL